MDTAVHKLLERGYRNKTTEDHDIGHRSDRGGQAKANEFTFKRLDLSLDCLLVLKRGAPGCETAITAL